MADPFVVPPGGFAAFAQMTGASRHALMPRSSIPRRVGSKKKRKARAKSKAAKSARRTTRGKKPKFGSPAWHKKYKTGKYKK